jgi:hypothetical protein
VTFQRGWRERHSTIDGLLSLARHSRWWIHPVEDWKPRNHNSRRQFTSLVRHLFAEWPVPSFMDYVWFLGNDAEAVRRQDWFRHVGAGRSIRTARLPLALTKRMVHHFMQAPSNFSIEAALRWGQVFALGGNEKLVRSILETRLASEFEHNDFWVTVLQFFVANDMSDAAEIEPIIDYLYDQRFDSRHVRVAPGVVECQGPPQPNFSVKGRTPESMHRLITRWRILRAMIEDPDEQWRASGIDGFEFVEVGLDGREKTWRITELLSTRDLVAEGLKMNHCVGSYARTCAHRISSIWTLECESIAERTKLLTIEVEYGARRISQVKGKCNRNPRAKEVAVLRRWAEKAGLTIGRDH